MGNYLYSEQQGGFPSRKPATSICTGANETAGHLYLICSLLIEVLMVLDSDDRR